MIITTIQIKDSMYLPIILVTNEQKIKLSKIHIMHILLLGRADRPKTSVPGGILLFE